ncbi:DNA helicase UvrD [Patescibacteria group bacterium]|nr:DNA helicase UvrD [Patescibacteria group bacterium]
MKTIIDLHIHSRFSRACSKELTLPNLARWAERKGIDLLGTGDVTHPAWRAEIKEQLEEVAPGIFALKKDPGKARFLLTTELSCIYKHNNKVRRVHHIVCFPSMAAVEHLVASLEKRGCNLRADGRPILGLSSQALLALVLEADPASLFIPAHAWTPWFAVFGSESGYDSLVECFGDELVKHIHAIETGLSSDPAMNWCISGLDSVMLVSNSDAHSLRNLGREANQMDLREMSYEAFAEILRTKDRSRFLQTFEFFPEEGKYYVDGHRACSVRLTPAETKKHGGLCPVCGKQVTVGVLHRIDALADRPDGVQPPSAVPFRHLIPLEEVIAEVLDVGKASKKVAGLYEKITADIASEFALLLDYPLVDLAGRVSDLLVEALRRVRAGEVQIAPGYDGEFGTVKIFSDADRGALKQHTLL